jgi:N-acetylglucosamine kinase-like BadF-type ATPase
MYREIFMATLYSNAPSQPPPSDSTASHESETLPSPYLLGVDGGGTRTRAVITDDSLNPLSEATGGASNPLRVGFDESASRIIEVVNRACSKAGINIGDIASACIALAGISQPDHYQAMKVALAAALDIENLSLTTDAEAALAGALDRQPGVVVIAGTGSIALGRNSRQEQTRSGGLGPVLADEGSGYDIARRALRIVAASLDGRAPQTLLVESVCARLRIDDPADLPRAIYDDGGADISSLAEVVSETARRGDACAREILASAGRELGALAASVIEKLKMREDQFRVACVGGVFEAGEFVLAPLREEVRKIAPRAEVGPPLFPPVIGAARIARLRAKVKG